MSSSSYTPLGNVSTGDLATAALQNTLLANVASFTNGPHELWLPAPGWRPHASSGCGVIEDLLLSSGRYVAAMPFDGAGGIESAYLTLALPKRWNESTVTFQPYWLNTAGGSGNVVWGLSAVAASDDDTLDVATGTEQTSTDTALTAKDVAVGPQSSAITIAGTPVASDLVRFKVSRDSTVGGDTYASDAYLVGLKARLTVDASDDA